MDLEDEIDEIDKDLDISWIKDYETLENDYKSFYQEDISFITYHFIYINKNNEIEKVKEEKSLLKGLNQITREEVIGKLKQYKISDMKNYNILFILKYNIDIEPADISHFLKSQHYENKFLSSMTNIDSIHLNPSITMFQDLNDIMFIFYEKDELKKINANKTKRICLYKHKKSYHKRDISK